MLVILIVIKMSMLGIGIISKDTEEVYLLSRMEISMTESGRRVK